VLAGQPRAAIPVPPAIGRDAPRRVTSDDPFGDARGTGEPLPPGIELVERQDARTDVDGDAVRERRLARAAAAVDDDPAPRIGAQRKNGRAGDRVECGLVDVRQRRFFLRLFTTRASARPATQTNGVSTTSSVTGFGANRNSLPRRT